MPAYYLGEHKITDHAKYEEYLRRVIPTIEQYGGRYLTRSGNYKVLEGNWRPNWVSVIEFPTMAILEAWFRSPEYQPLIALRQSASTDSLIAVEGL